MPNGERVLVSLLREIAAEGGYSLASFSHNWILRLEKEGRSQHIFGYNFEINSATARMMAADKAATADLLSNAKVPNVEHKLFLHPKLATYVSSAGNWDAMQAYAQKKGFPLVIKPNEGTGGEDIYKVDNPLELEQSVLALFESQRAISLSPFINIEQEYRVIVLDMENLLIYAKKRPQIVGDGQASVFELIEGLHQESQLSQGQVSRIIDSYKGALRQVPEDGQELVVGWKHNLGEGSKPLIVEDEALAAKLGKLAQSARKAINVRFASIDIVEVAGKLSVLEINAGVMMEYFTEHFPDQRAKVKAIYAKAVAEMFAAS
jgi:glutathione synthase/RimK-type ligase-like ATP-grasp enzyme